MHRLLPFVISPYVRLLRLFLLARLFFLVLILVAASLTVLADAPGRLRGAPMRGCYCHCPESHAHGGCAKMCEMKKYASRWWAKTCAKPHMQTPVDNSDAGPRLSHPDHAEHAQL